LILILAEDPTARVALLTASVTNADVDTIVALKTAENSVALIGVYTTWSQSNSNYCIAAGVDAEAMDVGAGAGIDAILGYGITGILNNDFNVAEYMGQE
jgi:hypothetical protein